jgi:hypothetical protein
MTHCLHKRRANDRGERERPGRRRGDIQDYKACVEALALLYHVILIQNLLQRKLIALEDAL